MKCEEPCPVLRIRITMKGRRGINMKTQTEMWGHSCRWYAIQYTPRCLFFQFSFFATILPSSYFIFLFHLHSYIHLHFFLFFIFSTHVLQDNSEDNNAYNGSRDTYDQNYESSGHESVALNSRSDKGIEESEGSAPHRSSTSASTFTPVLSSASSRTGTLTANYNSGPTPYVVPSVMKTSSAAGKR